MKTSIFISRQIVYYLMTLCLLLLACPAMAQIEDTSKVIIHVDNMQTMTGIKTDTGEFKKFTGNVVLRQGTDTLYCDSALQNVITKNFEAFSNVRIAQQGGTHGTSDYLKYTAAAKQAFMSGNVQMTDGKNKLDCTELTYNLGTKVAIYDKGGRLYNDSTTVTSQQGEYNIQLKEARFKGHVVIVDTQYRIVSEDLKYNTETKVTVFYAHSVVTRDSGRSILETSNGWYDGKRGIAHFTGRSSTWNNGQYISSISVLSYNKETGYGLAIDSVVCIDTGHHSTMYCGRAEYYQKQRVLWATIKPVLVQVNGKDTLYIRADTFYSAPMVRSRKPATDTGRLTIESRMDSLQVAIERQRGVDTTGGRKGLDSSGKGHQALALKDSVVAMPIAIGRKRSADSAGGVKGGDSSGKAPQTLVLKDSVVELPIARAPAQRDTVTDELYKPVVSKKFHVPLSKDDTGAVEEPVVLKPMKAGKKGKAVKSKSKKRYKDTDGAITVNKTDSAAADTTAPLYFIGYHHVLIFSDSLQGKCDSVCYTRADSLIRMMKSPIAWSHKSQIMGDTILMQLDSVTLRKMYVPNNSLIVSQSGPEQAHIWDQIQGKTLTAYFKDNTISEMIVKPDAECIYYTKDDKGEYLGVDQANSIRMFIYFANQNIKHIRFDRDVHHVLTPLEQADLPNTKLSKFKWLYDQRPASKEELFR